MLNFGDFEKAFDSVYREALWGILREYGIPDKLIRLIMAIYNGFRYAVFHDGKYSSFFAVK